MGDAGASGVMPLGPLAGGCHSLRLRVTVLAAGCAVLGALAGSLLGEWAPARWRGPETAVPVAAGAMLLVWLTGWSAAHAWSVLAQALFSRPGQAETPFSVQGPIELRRVVELLNDRIERRRQDMDRQRRLLADASHQLRTPLAVMRTVLQSTTAVELADRREELLRTVDRATAVVNEMLGRLKLEQRRGERLSMSLVRVDEVAREAAIEFAPLISAQGLQFELQAEPIEVTADEWMLGELVRNLLANAIRHSPEGGPLGIVLRSTAQGPELIVWDSGPGLGGAPRERLFEPFAASAGGGIGLGLSICRDLASAMGAQVELFNRTDGHRATGVDAVVRWGDGKPDSPSSHLSVGDPP